jgi:hypothetical protein
MQNRQKKIIIKIFPVLIYAVENTVLAEFGKILLEASELDINRHEDLDVQPKILREGRVPVSRN